MAKISHQRNSYNEWSAILPTEKNIQTKGERDNMNFGQNLYNWFLSNAQSLVLLAIVVIG